jgi:hypothetical protein
MVGIVVATPFFLFASFGILELFRWRSRAPHAQGLDTASRQSEDGLFLALLGGAILSFVTLGLLAFFFAVTMRYLADGITGLAILSSMGLALALERAESRPGLRRALSGAAVVLCAYTVVVGLLLWSESYYQFLRTNNPALHAALVKAFASLR